MEQLNFTASDRKRLAAFYGLIVSLFWTSQYLFVPALPQYLRERTSSLSAVGVVLSMYGLWQAVVRLPLGIAMDRLPRAKPFIIAGSMLTGAAALFLGLMVSVNLGAFTLGNMVLTAAGKRIASKSFLWASYPLFFLGTCGAALIPSTSFLLACEAVLGLAHGIGYPTLMGSSILKVDSAQRTTAMGLHQSIYAVGMFLGPWLSGMFADLLGLREMLALTSALALAAGWAGVVLLFRRGSAGAR